MQCVDVWCSATQCGAVWCSVVKGGAVCGAGWCSAVQCGEGWCSVLRCVAARCRIAVCCSVLQCVAVWHNVNCTSQNPTLSLKALLIKFLNSQLAVLYEVTTELTFEKRNCCT